MRVLLPILLVSAAVLAGCASNSATPPTAANNSTDMTPAPMAMVATIELGESPTAPGGPAVGPGSMYLTPKGFDGLTAGMTITINITNKGSETHDVVIDGTDFKSGDIAAGKSVTKTWTPTKDGTYTAYCDKGAGVPDPSGQNLGTHRGNGMQATITVKKAA